MDDYDLEYYENVSSLDDSPEEKWCITVKRSVYEAACELKRIDPNTPFYLAEIRRDECRAEGDDEGRAFFHEIWNYLMTLYIAADADTPVNIVPDDE